MIELEKKWLLREVPVLTKFGFQLLKSENITQSYLNKHERLRHIICNGAVYYQYFKKTPIAVGACVEDERDLTKEEYFELRKGVTRQLQKIRNSYIDPLTGYKYEVDYIKFPTPRVEICVLEIEFQDTYDTMEAVDAEFKLPTVIDNYVLADVTGMERFSNYALAGNV